MKNNELFQFKKRCKQEIIHYFDSEKGDYISSLANKFIAKLNGKYLQFTLPLPFKYKYIYRFRLIRRLLRLDKSNAAFNYSRSGIVALYQGKIYFYNITSGSLSIVGTLKQCRNILHGGILVTKNQLIFGEYGRNSQREAVPIWCSNDDGKNWNIIYTFQSGLIRHVHGVYEDPYSDSLWIPTGDFEDECYLFEVPNSNFSQIKRHGDGSQSWRAVSVFFRPDEIIWAMDSELQTSYLQIFNRKTQEIKKGRAFAGPVWYGKRFTDGSAVIQTTVELGNGVKSSYSYVYFSEDLKNWREVVKFKKDILPNKIFKSGVISFADGPQTRDNFALSCEALRGLDGKTGFARINL